MEKPSPQGTYGGITDEDVIEAMKDIPGYLDITPGDFKEVYRLAFRHAIDRISRTVTAAEIMTRDVFCVKVGTSLRETAALMAEKGVSGLPVLEDNGRVAGIISQKDFLARLGGGRQKNFMALIAECLGGEGCLALSVQGQKAGDIMSSPAVTVREETPMSEVIRIFREKGINRVPVVDAGGELKGIVSRNDIIRASEVKG